jgi:tetratricopeptide (TPR) repeat protein
MPRIRFLRSFLMFAALLIGTAALSAPAVAQSNAAETARATELFKSGKAAFARGDMVEAERLFSQALAIRQSSDIAANLAQSQLEQQKYRLAAQHFSWALANLLPSATDAQRKAVETGLARARTEVAILRLEIKPDGADVLVGAQAVGKAPIVGGVYVEPGEVIVSVRHEGFTAMDKRVLAGKGTEQAVEIVLNRKEVAAPPATSAPLARSMAPDISAPPADRSEPKSLVPAFVASGVAVAGGVVGLVFTLNANGKEDEADELRDRLEAMGGCNGEDAPSECADLRDQRDGVDSSRNLAIGSFVVAGAAAVVAGYFYWDALSQRSRVGARKTRRLYGLVPSVKVGRASAGIAVDSLRLGVSGTF